MNFNHKRPLYCTHHYLERARDISAQDFMTYFIFVVYSLGSVNHVKC